MDATSLNANTLSMKLLVDTKAERVLYAESGKDVVDFLFSLLALPIATAVKLLGEESMVGCVGNVYASVENLDDTYVQPGAGKDALLRPAVSSAGPEGSLFCLPAPAPAPINDPALPKKLFRCSTEEVYYTHSSFGGRYVSSPACDYVTETRDSPCPSCSCPMDTEVTPSGSRPPAAEAEATAKGNKNGLVRSIVTYTVMDDLKVAPMSSISAITLLNSFGITDIGVLQEKTVQLGYAEGLEIMRLSLQSKTVLTDVLLGKKVQKA